MGFTTKQRLFIEYYLQTWNATESAIKAGYSDRSAASIASENLTKPKIKAEIQRRIDEIAMSADEVLMNISDIARGSIEDVMDVAPTGKKLTFNFKKAKDANKLKLIKSVVPNRYGTKIEMYDRLSALQLLGKHHGLFGERGDGESSVSASAGEFSLPASMLSGNYYEVYRDIRNHGHNEYVFDGGRGSLKSSFISEIIIELIKNNPEGHFVALRQVAATLRDSVYSQFLWAINMLGLDDEFKCTTSPLEITYIPTGQKIYFRGADDPGKIKSIRPEFGYIMGVWFEEYDQFHGEEAVRKIVQSVIRGGDLAYIFKSFNPPKTIANFANKEIQIPKENRFVHHSTYLEAPPEWLGKAFIEEAEYLKKINPDAYEHEYLGVANGAGGMVFTNVTAREIADEEINGKGDDGGFDRVLQGLDWGYYPDPAHWVKMYYNAARRKLYIFDELRAWRTSNRALYDRLVEEKGYRPAQDQLIADSAEPKSIADFVAYGAKRIRGAEKGPDSVDYSIKWLQSLVEIVIDPARAPYTAQEFLNYEYLRNKDEEVIQAYPDKDNHAIDGARYATNDIWRRGGK
jgi:PBSX family phage terminase large subunit